MLWLEKGGKKISKVFDDITKSMGWKHWNLSETSCNEIQYSFLLLKSLVGFLVIWVFLCLFVSIGDQIQEPNHGRQVLYHQAIYLAQ